jgi:hypothetical protein
MSRHLLAFFYSTCSFSLTSLIHSINHLFISIHIIRATHSYLPITRTFISITFTLSQALMWTFSLSTLGSTPNTSNLPSAQEITYVRSRICMMPSVQVLTVLRSTLTGRDTARTSQVQYSAVRTVWTKQCSLCLCDLKMRRFLCT